MASFKDLVTVAQDNSRTNLLQTPLDLVTVAKGGSLQAKLQNWSLFTQF